MEVIDEVKTINFWCEYCRKDFLKLPARRRIKNDTVGMAWFVKCPLCRRELIRLHNNAKDDPYFLRSEKVKSDTLRYARDIIQIDHPDFDLLYPHIRKEREDKAEKIAREEWEKENKKSSRDRKKLTL